MVDQNLADKCRRWVEECANTENSSTSPPTPIPPYRPVSQSTQTKPSSPSYSRNNQRSRISRPAPNASNRTERRNVRATCSFEKSDRVDRDYHSVEAANIEARIHAKSKLGKFDTDSLYEIFGQFGKLDVKGSYGKLDIKIGYLFLPKLFSLITGKEPTYYCDKDTERHVEMLLSQLKENAIHKAEAIGADLVVMERDKIYIREDMSPPIIHIVTIKLGMKYSFHYHMGVRAEFYRRNT